MLTDRDRGWVKVKESLRRQRHVQDLLNRSRWSRRAKRVTMTGNARDEWRRTERPIREVEQAILTLDDGALDFWVEYRKREQQLIELYRDAGIRFGTEEA